ncbi:MAG: TonB-dependent receptor [Chitinophagia bacterium]|nr:TonB-dependent receptor [Chitinophagia bacterium]
MKKTVITLLAACSMFAAHAQSVFKGNIFDKVTGRPVSNARIYFPDLGLSAVTDTAGYYEMKAVPFGQYQVQIDAATYGTVTVLQSLKDTEVSNRFFLTQGRLMEEVVVTGVTSARDIVTDPQPFVSVSHDYLLQNAATNIIDALKWQPGVDGITDGQSIAKPVIRGLGYNRVVVINDGVRQEGQQWGDEFGIEVDQYAVDRVEILKGPASLVYGSDAISGVINLLPEKPAAEGEINGNILVNYQTNNGLIGTSGSVKGNIKGVTFSARVSNTMAHAYQNKTDGYVFNSQFSNFSTDGTIGLQRKWGYSQLKYSYFELKTGIVEGAKDENGQFIKSAVDEHGEGIEVVATNQELRSYTPFVINQLVKHNKLVWDNYLSLGKAGHLKGIFGYQNNSRNENNDITVPNTVIIGYNLNTYTYDLRYVSPTFHNFDFSAGVNGMYQTSRNKGSLLLIPEYDLLDAGAFAVLNKKIGKLTLTAGARYQTRHFTGHDNYVDSNNNPVAASDPAAIHRFEKYTSDFNGFAYSLGGTYDVNNKFYLKASIASGYRAPNVAESGSNGIHDGTILYEIGDNNLKPEQSLQFDFTPGFRTKDVNIELNGFYNNISNFIYIRQLMAMAGGDSVNSSVPGFENAPVYKYTQNDAVLMGGEASIDIHPSSLRWLGWYTMYSYVDARLQNVDDSLNIIPFIPPARLRSELTFSLFSKSKTFANTYFKVGVAHSFEQNRVYQIISIAKEIDRLPNAPAYTLLNVGAGTQIMSHGKPVCSLYLNVNNLLDESYTDYMSRFRFVQNANANGTTSRFVNNMGRNVSIKVAVPLNFKTPVAHNNDEPATHGHDE